jgi:hypothetical protein
MLYKVIHELWLTDNLSSNYNVVAHKGAYKTAHILHHDISVGNILITNDGHELLVNWDLCEHVKDLAVTTRQSERTVRAFFIC